MRFGNRGVVSPGTEELAGERVAFTNAEGGVVFLGIDDPGAVHGISPEHVKPGDPESAFSIGHCSSIPLTRQTLNREIPGLFDALSGIRAQ